MTDASPFGRTMTVARDYKAIYIVCQQKRYTRYRGDRGDLVESRSAAISIDFSSARRRGR